MSRSLGVLTLDLIARTGGFESGMDKAQRTADKKLRQIEREAQARAKAIEDAFATIGGGIAAAFAGIQISDTVRQFFEFGNQIQRSASVANIAARDLQIWTAATKSLGIEQEKLADIFKDIDDKVGDFTANGAGPMKDFVDQWGKAAGITAEQLKRLAGPEVLQLVTKTMEAAGASTSETTFMLEALASDASHLTPILADNAKGLKEAGERAQSFGLILSDETLGGIKEVNKGVTDLQDAGAGWVRQLGTDLIPTLLEVKRNLDAVWTTLDSMGVAISGVISVAFKTLATAAITVSKAFEYAGSAIGGTLAALSFAATGDFSAALNVLKEMDKELARIDSSMSGAVARVWTGGTKIEPLATPARTEGNSKPTGNTGGNKPRSSKQGSYNDPLADSAKAYASAMEALNKAQQDADVSGLNLTTTQSRLIEIMSSPEFFRMPESWRVMVAQQGEYALAAEQSAAEHEKLNALLAGTPTAQLEAQRATMQFLAEAFEKGRISVEQYNEAVNAALGNTAPLEKMQESVLSLETVMNDAARNMADAFTDFAMGVETDAGKMAEAFIADILRMIVQAQMLQAVQGAMGLFGFAKGGVFDGGVQPFASGGVVNSPTFFKFASGGGFKNGLMGEAGPEAILPLKRGSDGKLGVSMNGSGGSNVVVNVHEAPGTQARVQQGTDAQGNLTLDIVVEQIEGKMAANLARGRSQIGSTMENVYGLNRAAGARR